MYLHDWKDNGFISMVDDFEDIGITAEDWVEQKQAMDAALASEKWKDLEVLLASYTYENYYGEAFVLFKRDGKLYEVNGSHCSCYGLEGQWKPEETSIEALRHRLDEGDLGKDYDGGNVFADELRQVLDDLQTRRVPTNSLDKLTTPP